MSVLRDSGNLRNVFYGRFGVYEHTYDRPLIITPTIYIYIYIYVNSTLRQEIVDALYEHGFLVFRNQAHLIPQDEIAFPLLRPHQLDDKNVSYTRGARIQYRLFPNIPQLSSWVLTLTKFMITMASHNFAS